MSTQFDLKGKVAVVIGGLGNIGTAITSALSKAEASVHVAGVGEVYEGHESAFVHVLDHTDAAAVNQLFDRIAEDGGIDILVNAGGMYLDNLLRKMPPEDWAKVIDVDLNGPAYCCAAAMRIMAAQNKAAADGEGPRGGAIVSLGSVAAHGNMRQPNYSAAKMGLVGMSNTLALEGARDQIRVNVIHPGPVAGTTMITDLDQRFQDGMLDSTPMGQMVTPEDIANAVQFLVSPAARLITGQAINVSAGIEVGI